MSTHEYETVFRDVLWMRVNACQNLKVLLTVHVPPRHAATPVAAAQSSTYALSQSGRAGPVPMLLSVAASPHQSTSQHAQHAEGRSREK